jgi:hypothetical protein
MRDRASTCAMKGASLETRGGGVRARLLPSTSWKNDSVAVEVDSDRLVNPDNMTTLATCC